MNRKRINKKWIILIVIIVLLVLLVGTIGAYYLLNKNDTPIEHKIYNEFDMVGGKIDDNTYYLLGVSNDINFEVIKKDNFSYEIKDAKDNKIHSQLVDNVIKPPQDLYEKE